MLLAIESFVRLFDRLLIGTSTASATSTSHADNDNAEVDEDERRWVAFR